MLIAGIMHTFPNLQSKFSAPNHNADKKRLHESVLRIPLCHVVTGGIYASRGRKPGEDEAAIIAYLRKTVFDPSSTDWARSESAAEVCKETNENRSVCFYAGRPYNASEVPLSALFPLPLLEREAPRSRCSPFDSGGMVDTGRGKKSRLPGGKGYIAAHTCGISDYTSYFSLHLLAFFKGDVDFYWKEPQSPIDGIDLKEKEWKNWTFEIRSPQPLSLKEPAKLFVTRGIEKVISTNLIGEEWLENLDIMGVDYPVTAAEDAMKATL